MAIWEGVPMTQCGCNTGDEGTTFCDRHRAKVAVMLAEDNHTSPYDEYAKLDHEGLPCSMISYCDGHSYPGIVVAAEQVYQMRKAGISDKEIEANEVDRRAEEAAREAEERDWGSERSEDLGPEIDDEGGMSESMEDRMAEPLPGTREDVEGPEIDGPSDAELDRQYEEAHEERYDYPD